VRSTRSRDKLLVDPGCVVGGAVRFAAYFARGRRRAVRLASARCRSGAAGFKVGALDADVGSRTQQLQALLARVQNTTVHIKDLSLGKLEHAATPGTALGVDGAVRARVRFAPQQRCVESDACRAELASHCYQQLLAGRAMLASRRRTCRREQRLAACCVSDAAGDAAARGLSIANVRASADCGQLSQLTD
jgi:hypothetical protein